DGGDSRIQLLVADDDFKFYFGQKVHRVFAAAVDFGVTFLAAKAFDLADGHAFDANASQGVFYFLKFEWFYDCFDFFHRESADGDCAGELLVHCLFGVHELPRADKIASGKSNRTEAGLGHGADYAGTMPSSRRILTKF